MKKIIALVLAVAMLSTVAFATSIATGTSDTDVSNPGTELVIGAGAFKDLVATDIDYRFSSEYFTVTAKKFTKGANLVKGVAFNDDDNTLEITLLDNIELVRPDTAKAPNLVIDKLQIKAKKNYSTTAGTVVTKHIEKNKIYSYTGEAELFIGYDLQEKELGDTPVYLNGKLVKFIDKVGSDAYDTASISEGDLYIEGRVYKNDKVYVKIDNKADKPTLVAYPDADLRFYNVKTNGFPSTNTINLTAEKDEFVYKNVDGKLVASGLKWSEDDYAWVGKIRADAKYVVSDVELKVAAAEGTTTNPDTGANDVVGIAAALAIVSLVAAGAVSMKK